MHLKLIQPELTVLLSITGYTEKTLEQKLNLAIVRRGEMYPVVRRGCTCSPMQVEVRGY